MANPNVELVELHSHLYGCLTIDDLYWLAARKPPRREIWLQSYKKTYNQNGDFNLLFTKSKSGQQYLKQCYYFKQPGNFLTFQTSFDLVISVSHTDPEELIEICSRVAARETAQFAEYRMMFSPFESESKWKEKLHALCEGLSMAEKQTGKTLRLAMSLSRDVLLCKKQYAWLRDIQAKEPVVQKILNGIDFCAQEEGYPPKQLYDFFKQVQSENKQQPKRELKILYHVGESFEDKSVESAIRWILEAAKSGAHRLGHALALGIPANCFLQSTRIENPKERIDQIQYYIQHESELKNFDCLPDLDQLTKELKNLKSNPDQKTISVSYDERQTKQLHNFQEYAMQQLHKTNIVIESCPTSNLGIANLSHSNQHPLARFLKADLPVVIASDDPGILQTSLKQEFSTIERWPEIKQKDIEKMQALATNYIKN